MSAVSYLPSYLDNPDQIPIEDIPQTLDATDNVLQSVRLAIEGGLDLIRGPRALNQIEAVHNSLKQRLLDYVQGVKGLPGIDIVQYEQQNGPMNHHALYASVNHLADEEEKSAFSLSGSLSHASKHISILREVYELILKIITVTSPITGIKPSAAQSNAAFQRDVAIPKNAVHKPDALYMALFTREALALIQQEQRAEEQQDEDDIKALRDVSLIHFFVQKEDEKSEEYAASKSGKLDCRTQTQEGISSLVLGGEAKAEIWLWENDTVLTWRLIDETFETQEQFTFAETALQAGTAAWNRVRPGGVRFERSDTVADATFKVRFAKGKGTVGASAFFPYQYIKGKSALVIYSIAFRAQFIAQLSKVLCHELGHILGFRHEFALEKERTPAGRYGKKDPNSIMGYSYPPLITLLDVTTSRDAYQHFQGGGEFTLYGKSREEIKFKVTRRSLQGV